MKKAIFLTLTVLCFALPALESCRGQGGGGVPTLVWYQHMPGEEPYREEVTTALSDYTQEKIGLRFEIREIKKNTDPDEYQAVFNSGEYFDIMFINALISQFAPQGVFADITGAVRTQTPALWNYIPQMIWDGVKIDGKIYTVPAYKDVSATIFLFWNKQYADKYKLDTSKRPYTIQDFDRDLRTVKAGEGPDFYPYWSAGTNDLWPDLWLWDDLGSGAPIGVRMNDTRRRVQIPYDTPEYLEKLRIYRQWYRDGIVNPDAPQLAEMPLGRTVYFDIAWPSKAQTLALSQGIDAYVPIDLCTPYVNTGQVRGSSLALGAKSKYINESLKFIELINTDHKFRDMLAYGIEGKNFEYVSPNVVRRLTNTYLPGEWTQGTFFNLSTMDTQPANTWEQVRGQNQRAVSSAVFGFSMDISGLRSEIAACNAVKARYAVDLVYGPEEPEVSIPRMMAELRAAGLDRIAAEAQRQIDVFFK